MSSRTNLEDMLHSDTNEHSATKPERIYRILPRSQALIYEVQIKEVFENTPKSPHVERVNCCFRILKDLIPQSGIFSEVLMLSCTNWKDRLMNRLDDARQEICEWERREKALKEELAKLKTNIQQHEKEKSEIHLITTRENETLQKTIEELRSSLSQSNDVIEKLAIFKATYSGSTESNKIEDEKSNTKHTLVMNSRRRFTKREIILSGSGDLRAESLDQESFENELENLSNGFISRIQSLLDELKLLDTHTKGLELVKSKLDSDKKDALLDRMGDISLRKYSGVVSKVFMRIWGDYYQERNGFKPQLNRTYTLQKLQSFIQEVKPEPMDMARYRHIVRIIYPDQPFYRCFQQLDYQNNGYLSYDDFDEALSQILPTVPIRERSVRYKLAELDGKKDAVELERLAHIAAYIMMYTCYKSEWANQSLISHDFIERVGSRDSKTGEYDLCFGY
ncbi:hypothetical protein BSLG_005011 [Batrachochytrium salamandrivorans]|nr:hypothetical protein BSLG_005011 [Batrachochytrium salamandrivorans]